MNPEGGDRLRDVDPEFGRLVSALRTGRPSKDALARTLAAVGSATTEAVAAPEAGGRAAKSATIAIGAGVMALIVAAGAGYEWTRSDASAPSATAPVATSPAPARQDPAPVDVPTSSVRVEDLPPVPAPAPEPVAPAAAPARAIAGPKGAPSAAPVAAASNEPAPAGGDDFRDELALVERVRTQLSSGDHEACLRSIDRYNARFQHGAFVQEVEVMRIEALASSGDRERARAFGGKFLSDHPTSPYAGRVRSVLERSK